MYLYDSNNITTDTWQIKEPTFNHWQVKNIQASQQLKKTSTFGKKKKTIQEYFRNYQHLDTFYTSKFWVSKKREWIYSEWYCSTDRSNECKSCQFDIKFLNHISIKYPRITGQLKRQYQTSTACETHNPAPYPINITFISSFHDLILLRIHFPLHSHISSLKWKE